MARLFNRRKLRKKEVSLLVSLGFALLVGVMNQLGWLDGLTDAAIEQQPGSYRVTRYVDGDTIEIDMNGSTEKVRFIGVDTPETHKPNTPVQCYGPAAAAHTKNIISAAGGHVRLAADPENTNRDRYNRLLRYVYLPDGTMLNETNIREGYGFYYPYFPFSKSAQFARAQDEAQKAGRGLWGACSPERTDRGGWTMPS